LRKYGIKQQQSGGQQAKYPDGPGPVVQVGPAASFGSVSPRPDIFAMSKAAILTNRPKTKKPLATAPQDKHNDPREGSRQKSAYRDARSFRSGKVRRSTTNPSRPNSAAARGGILFWRFDRDGHTDLIKAASPRWLRGEIAQAVTGLWLRRKRCPTARAAITLVHARTVAGSGAATWSIVPAVGE
jgi:hypothetical protein